MMCEGIGRLHPSLKVRFEYFIDEGFDQELDVVFCLKNIHAILHIQISLSFDRNTELVLDEVH